MVDRAQEGVESAIDELRNHYGGKVFDQEVRRDAALEEAPSQGQDIFHYAPESAGAADYGRVLDEVEERLERYGSVFSKLTDRSPRTSAATAE
jgi:chromosome partitioning protein